MIKDWLYTISASAIGVLFLATSVVAQAPKELPTKGAEIYAVWVTGEMIEPIAREKMREAHEPTPEMENGQWLGVNIPTCQAPDGTQYGVQWPVFTVPEKDMWNQILASNNAVEAAALFQAYINGVQILWDMADLSEEAKDNWLTKLEVIARDCMPQLPSA